MWANSCEAKNEMDRRYAFVSEGAQTARWLRRLVRDGLYVCGNRVFQSAGKALIAVGIWLQQKRQLGSARS
jgi:hypothetical protein